MNIIDSYPTIHLLHKTELNCYRALIVLSRNIDTYQEIQRTRSLLIQLFRVPTYLAPNIKRSLSPAKEQTKNIYKT